jgi:hypothetical protein
MDDSKLWFCNHNKKVMQPADSYGSAQEKVAEK